MPAKPRPENTYGKFLKIASTPTAPVARPITILIADENQEIRAGLKQLIERDPGLSVVGEATYAPEVLRQIILLKPRVVLVHPTPHNLDGADLIRKIKQLSPECGVLELVDCRAGWDGDACMKAGGNACCLPGLSVDRLKMAINAVSQGAVWIDSELSQCVLRGSHKAGRAGKGQQSNTELLFDSSAAASLPARPALQIQMNGYAVSPAPRGFRTVEILALSAVAIASTLLIIPVLQSSFSTSGRMEVETAPPSPAFIRSGDRMFRLVEIR